MSKFSVHRLGEFVGLRLMRTGARLQKSGDVLFGQVVPGTGVQLNVIAVKEPFEIRLVRRCTRRT